MESRAVLSVPAGNDEHKSGYCCSLNNESWSFFREMCCLSLRPVVVSGRDHTRLTKQQYQHGSQCCVCELIPSYSITNNPSTELPNSSLNSLSSFESSVLSRLRTSTSFHICQHGRQILLLAHDLLAQVNKPFE